jgi:uncharacterized protein YjbI with pentapeptide repeats
MAVTTAPAPATSPRRARELLHGFGAVVALLWSTGYLHEGVELLLKAYSRRAVLELLGAEPDRIRVDLGRIPVPPDVRVSCQPRRLVRADLSQMDLLRAAFEDVKLSNTNWSDATLKHCEFTSCKLTAACFDAARIDQTTFDGCDLTFAKLTADVVGARFGRCALTQARASAGNLAGTRFRACSMKWFRAQKAVLRDASFEDCDLRRAFLSSSDLSGAHFRQCSLEGADATDADIRDAIFEDCDLTGTQLEGSYLSHARFVRCTLTSSDLTKAELRGATFEECTIAPATFGAAHLADAAFSRCTLAQATFDDADLTGARFSYCDLRGASWSNATIEGAALDACHIFGMILWGTRGELARARDLMLTRENEANAPEVDGLHIAVFVASLLDGNGVRDLIDGPTSTMVLVLGRFSLRHKRVLDAIRDGLRSRGYSAIVFDSAAPSNRDTSETISVLAKLSRFVIADVTEPRSSPYELMQFAPACRTPVLAVTRGERPFSMLRDLEKYPWVLPAEAFADDDALLEALPALVDALEQRRSEVRDRLEP